MFELSFFDANAFAVLEKLSERGHYLRELAAAMGLSPSMVHKVLSRLAGAKVVSSRMQKNRKLFSVNYSSPLAARALGLMAVHKIISAPAFKGLVRLKPLGIFLFGTAASGRITGDSDIDLAVFFGKKPDSFRLSGIKRELSSELKREVQLVVLTAEKIEGMKRGQVELLNQIKIGSVVLWGEMFG